MYYINCMAKVSNGPKVFYFKISLSSTEIVKCIKMIQKKKKTFPSEKAQIYVGSSFVSFLCSRYGCNVRVAMYTLTRRFMYYAFLTVGQTLTYMWNFVFRIFSACHISERWIIIFFQEPIFRNSLRTISSGLIEINRNRMTLTPFVFSSFSQQIITYTYMEKQNKISRNTT